jgi:hypothetical protein
MLYLVIPFVDWYILFSFSYNYRNLKIFLKSPPFDDHSKVFVHFPCAYVFSVVSLVTLGLTYVLKYLFCRLYHELPGIMCILQKLGEI